VAQIGGKRSVVADGQPGPAYDWIMAGSPFFSPDSQHLAYEAVQADKGFVVVDGKLGPANYVFPEGSRLVFDNPTSLHTIAGHNNKLVRLEVTITK
jgi:hypothetical protein